nr:hypothetical protein [Tanacetum cinerariifolium]
MNSPPNHECEQSLDIYGFDLRITLVIRPYNNLYITPETTTTTQTLVTSQNHQVDSCGEKPFMIIPGAVGIVQASKLRKIAAIREGGEDSVIAVEFVNVDGAIVSGCFGDIKKFCKKMKLDKVVAIIKSSTPNAMDDPTVTLKDLYGTILVVFITK